MARFILALFAGGIFWLMVLFFVEKAWMRSRLPGVRLMAALVMMLSALTIFAVTDEGAWTLISGRRTPAASGQHADTHAPN